MTTPRIVDRIPAVLRDLNFRRFWTAQTISYMGDQVTMIALPLIAVLALHASAAQVAFLWTIESLPNLFFSLHAGVMVDRRGRRRTTMIAMDLLRAATLASVPIAWGLDALTMAQLYVVIFVTGSLAVLFNVCSYSLFAALVPREHMVSGTSLSRGSFSFSWVAGPGFGGLLIQVLSAPFVILLDVASFLASAVLLRGVRVTEPESDPDDPSGVGEGLRFVLRTRTLLVKFVAGTALNFFYAIYFTLMILFAARVLGLTAGQIGLVLSGGAFGALLGTMVTSRISKRVGIGPTFVIGSFVFPAALALTPLAGGGHWASFGTVLLGEFISGAGLMLSDIAGSSIQQVLTPDRVRSRVQGAHMAIQFGSRPIGSLVAGALGTWWGLRQTLWFAVVGGVLSAVVLFWSPIPRMHELPERAE
jgi:MFS family permease